MEMSESRREITCLVHAVIDSGKWDTKIRMCIGIGKYAFNRLKFVLKYKKISLVKMKKKRWLAIHYQSPDLAVNAGQLH